MNKHFITLIVLLGFVAAPVNASSGGSAPAPAAGWFQTIKTGFSNVVAQAWNAIKANPKTSTAIGAGVATVVGAGFVVNHYANKAAKAEAHVDLIKEEATITALETKKAQDDAKKAQAEVTAQRERIASLETKLAASLAAMETCKKSSESAPATPGKSTVTNKAEKNALVTVSKKIGYTGRGIANRRRPCTNCNVTRSKSAKVVKTVRSARPVRSARRSK